MDHILITEIELNSVNPRTISDSNMERLIQSLLLFPKMLELRPVVIDARKVAMGGNQRTKGLTAISQMFPDELMAKLKSYEAYNKMPVPQQAAILDHWLNWLSHPIVPVTRAEGLTDAELKEFIIKDNLPYGEWDKDVLGEVWDHEDLKDWGLDMNFPDEEDGGGGDPGPVLPVVKKLIVESGEMQKLEFLYEELKERGFEVTIKE